MADLPLQIDTGDRGPAPFFHGRQHEISAFQAAQTNARLSNGGSIFLVQGPPGAGKTALLHECTERARDNDVPWKTRTIESDALHSPAALAEQLDISNSTKTSEHTGTAVDKGISAGFAASFSHSQGKQLEGLGTAVRHVLREAATPNGLVLILDEAQNIEGDIIAGTLARSAARVCLEQIHNGEIGVPVILLAGGLGTSEKVFGEFGIGRFRDDYVHQLGGLDYISTRKVIRDWLTKYGGVPSAHEHLARWIDVLSKESYGWPQHIQCYAFVAAEWLLKNGRMPSPQVPPDVLSDGRRRRESYYLGRARGIIEQDRVSLADLIQTKGKDSTLSREDLVQTLLENRTREQAEEKFDHLLHKGMVAETPRGGYIVPIRSMQDWLIREYATAAR